MKAITLTRPWSALVVRRRKLIETRSWGTSYRGPLAIHAGKGPGDFTEAILRELISQQPFADALRLPCGRSAYLEDLPAGAIVAVCWLSDCREMASSSDDFYFDAERHFDIAPDGPLTRQERAFGFYEPGRFAWILEDIVPIDPLSVRGMQGLWDVPKEIAFTHSGKPVIGCYSCGRLLPITTAVEFDRPISPGNPYPDSYYGCHRQQCQDDLQQWIESEYRSIQEQVDEMVANGDLEEDNMYR